MSECVSAAKDWTDEQEEQLVALVSIAKKKRNDESKSRIGAGVGISCRAQRMCLFVFVYVWFSCYLRQHFLSSRTRSRIRIRRKHCERLFSKLNHWNWWDHTQLSNVWLKDETKRKDFHFPNTNAFSLGWKDHCRPNDMCSTCLARN